jgi:hypothetical protein
VIKNNDTDAIRKEFQKKLNDQKTLNEQDIKKLSSLLEKEADMADKYKQSELSIRKLELEARQKEALFEQELEKSERTLKSKDLIVLKTKESFTKLIERKDKDLFEMKLKADQMLKAFNSNSANNNTQVIKDLEKNNQNLIKQLDMMKAKVTSLVTNLQPTKSEDLLKEECRKLQTLNQQIKNMLDLSKKDVEKMQTKLSIEAEKMSKLQQEKTKLEALLKNATAEAKGPAASTVQSPQQEQEFKKLTSQNKLLENQVKEGSQKISALETKLSEALKSQKPNSSSLGDDSKKAIQLEGTVKKLTLDLVNCRNEMAEAKKELIKIRQEKTALQNLVDKMKKEADKSKPAAAKRPGGKAA